MHNTSKTGCCACPPGDSPPLFPRFRARFFFGWDLGVQQVGTGEAGMHGGTTPSGQAHRPALKTLDLAALTGSKEDGPPSETQLRRQKYQFFEKQCSEIAPGLYLGGDYVARNREIIGQHGITHVINCVGFICKEYFQGELQYLTYYLQDTPAEDILCILYNAFEFIDQAIANGGRVLVHCSQDSCSA
uniref:Dual specificity phosphatase catalytic domain-containing protein n=1 Tax=Dunaliella tertiolecta TaxID=3047 RepID=A0A7S3VNY1_DUNTE